MSTPSDSDDRTQLFSGFSEDETVRSAKSESFKSRQIGPYKLLEHIGEGGMGSVVMAEQEKPVSRRVALKLIKGAANKKVIARFESERQALAMMNHENIARILDAEQPTLGLPIL